MTQEERQLLLVDLSARLPYGVIVHLEYDENTPVTRELGIGSLHDIMVGNAEGKPYLRPMYSMTEEEQKYYRTTWHELSDTETIEYVDWLNAHHFDYRGLIPKGLALEAPEGMYKK